MRAVLAEFANDVLHAMSSSLRSMKARHAGLVGAGARGGAIRVST
jgi:hypothetical protein